MTQKRSAKRSDRAEGPRVGTRGSQPTERTRAGKKKFARQSKNPKRRSFNKRFLAAGEQILRPQDIPTARAIFCEQIEMHGSPTRAGIEAGVGRRTFYDWVHEDEDFRKAYYRARRIWRMNTVDDVEASFGERAQVRDTLAGIVLLKNNRKRYREVSRVQLSGPDGGPIVTLDAKEELIKRLEKLHEREKQRAQIIGGVAVGDLPAGSAGSQGPKGPKGPQLSIVRAGSGGSGVRRVKDHS